MTSLRAGKPHLRRARSKPPMPENKDMHGKALGPWPDRCRCNDAWGVSMSLKNWVWTMAIMTLWQASAQTWSTSVLSTDPTTSDVHPHGKPATGIYKSHWKLGITSEDVHNKNKTHLTGIRLQPGRGIAQLANPSPKWLSCSLHSIVSGLQGPQSSSTIPNHLWMAGFSLLPSPQLSLLCRRPPPHSSLQRWLLKNNLKPVSHTHMIPIAITKQSQGLEWCHHRIRKWPA